MSLLRNVFIVGAKRTAFGAYGGKLRDHTATDLAVLAGKATLEQAKVAPEAVTSVVVGMVGQTSEDGAYISRHTGLRCGIPDHVPALTVNRLCGSGFQAMITGAQEIQLKESEVVLTGGSENMSNAPYALWGVRYGTKFGQDLKLKCQLWATLTDQYIKTPMGITAENLAEKYSLTKADCDAFALLSQQRWKTANTAGVFKEEITPITIKSKKGEITVDTDEHPRDTSLEILGKLPCVFKKGGTVSAGNASGVCDGAAMVLVASEDAVKQHNLKPLAKLVAYSVSGCDPHIMGIGPVPAIRNLLTKTGLELKDIDVIEVNEAFAPQFLSVQKELGLDMENTNVNGGAIALGHPVAASGGRITANLTYELQRRQGRYAIGSACIGGGQGIAVLLERC
ncbi:PREDICTED: 3-ketoacyl-CoA thiolase, mitochondrial-like [Priapulus caudatus]|uniref:3-ketoacyl-CoA thiolase, mitochondrial-like n=1 Tax=Priapulus caudatus TaxID=37621 RepID=A0ABM1F8N5_PRICU|nr:PREDICTED: 3-ketoacyl-CoA thiolase, mitochondrial-like [Priapulus caudatus]